MIPLEFFKQSISSEIQTKLVVSNFRVKLEGVERRGERQRGRIITSLSMLESSFCCFFFGGSLV